MRRNTPGATGWWLPPPESGPQASEAENHVVFSGLSSFGELKSHLERVKPLTLPVFYLIAMNRRDSAALIQFKLKNILNSISRETIVCQRCIFNHVFRVMYRWLKNLLIFILLLRTLIIENNSSSGGFSVL